jgi:hypothetical protein
MPVDDDGRTPTPKALTVDGRAAGALATVGFMVVHDLMIADIWSSARRMVLAGALCGLRLTWSYGTAVTGHTEPADGWPGTRPTGRSGRAGLDIPDGPRPRFTIAEMLADDALQQLLPPALPLMGVTTVAGTGIILLVSNEPARPWCPSL